jgi:hypothetical protein
MVSHLTTTRLLVLVIAVFLFAPTFARAEAPKTKADHIALAEKYEKMAADQEAIAEEHRTMLEEYKANAHRYPKQVREKWIAEMKKHCKAIIRASEQLATEYKGMAKWHRTAAADLEE